MSRSRKLSFVAGGVVAFILLAAVAYFVIRQGDASAEATDIIQSAEASEAAVPVEVVEAATGWVARTLSTSSTVEAEQSAQVLAKVSGVVTEVAVREGTFVEKNQILAKVDDEEKKLALEKAVLTLKKAEAELNRAKLSFDQELISRFDYEKAIFDRDLARAGRETAELEFRYTEIKAPFAGRVTAKEIVVGKATQLGDRRERRRSESTTTSPRTRRKTRARTSTRRTPDRRSRFSLHSDALARSQGPAPARETSA